MTKTSTSEASDCRPKRARSAYNYFFRAERAKILGIKEEELDAKQNEKRKHRKTPGMIGFANLASFVGEKWKELSEEEKMPYHLKSEADKERYAREYTAWKQSQRTPLVNVTVIDPHSNQDIAPDRIQSYASDRYENHYDSHMRSYPYSLSRSECYPQGLVSHQGENRGRHRPMYRREGPQCTDPALREAEIPRRHPSYSINQAQYTYDRYKHYQGPVHYQTQPQPRHIYTGAKYVATQIQSRSRSCNPPKPVFSSGDAYEPVPVQQLVHKEKVCEKVTEFQDICAPEELKKLLYAFE